MTNLTQAQFFGLIKSKAADSNSIAPIVSDVLGVALDSAYRRLRCQKELTFQEAITLARHFGVSLDEVAQIESDAMVFQNRDFISCRDDMSMFSAKALNVVEQCLAFENHHFYYIAKDLPFFYYFLEPEVAKFKIFFWLKTLYADPAFKDLKFNPSLIPDQFLSTGMRAMNSYFKLRSSEIWHNETIDSILSQIMYFHEIHAFESKEIGVVVLEKLKKILETIQDQASNGRRNHYENSPHDEFSLFHNQILLNDNSIYTEAGSVHTSFLIYAGINFVKTTDKGFNQTMKKWVERQMQKSTLISVNSEKERSSYFSKMYIKIDETIKKIN